MSLGDDMMAATARRKLESRMRARQAAKDEVRTYQLAVKREEVDFKKNDVKKGAYAESKKVTPLTSFIDNGDAE